MPAQARECSQCGFRLLEDDWRGWRDPDAPGVPRAPKPSGRAAALAAGVAVFVAALAVAGALLISGGGDSGAATSAGDGTAAPRPSPPEVISDSPLSDQETEAALEERFVMPNDDASAAHCTPRDPKPAHALRRCEVYYPNGAVMTVLVVTNAQGRELIGRILR